MGQEYTGHLDAAARHLCHRDRRGGPQPRPAFGQFRWRRQNPIRVLARILGDMHDGNGKVRMPGFYDGISEAVGQAAPSSGQGSASMPASFWARSGLSAPAGERRYSVLEQIWARPTVEFNGITGGYQGVGTKTVIPSQRVGEDHLPPGAGTGPAKRC